MSINDAIDKYSENEWITSAHNDMNNLRNIVLWGITSCRVISTVWFRLYKVQKHAKQVHISFRKTDTCGKTKNNNRHKCRIVVTSDREKGRWVGERHKRDFNDNKNVEKLRVFGFGDEWASF